MKHAPLSVDGTSSATTYSEEDGKTFIGHHIELDTHIKRVSQMREIRDMATRASNPNGWELAARVPIPVITNWLAANGFTLPQFARNEGGIRGKAYPESKSGVKDKFMAFFLSSRDFTKLNNEHLTNKRESSQIVLPDNYVGSK